MGILTQGPWKDRPVKGGEQPPYDGDMEHRVTALETRLDAVFAHAGDQGRPGARLRRRG